MRTLLHLSIADVELKNALAEFTEGQYFTSGLRFKDWVELKTHIRSAITALEMAGEILNKEQRRAS